jgi:TRAP-type C4-dicarboxylate transport system permease small subunit
MSALLKTLARVHDMVTAAAAWLAALGLVLITASYVFEVVVRYFFNSPTSWVNDFVSYALCASIFMALPKVTKDRAHVAVTIVVDIIKPALAHKVHFVVYAIGFVSCLLAAYLGGLQVYREYTKEIVTLAINPVPQWRITIFIFFGFLWSAFYFLRYLNQPAEPDQISAVG